MKVFISSQKQQPQNITNLYVDTPIIAGDRPYYVDINSDKDGYQYVKFVYPQNEPHIKKLNIENVRIDYGTITGRIYCIGSNKPIKKTDLLKKLSTWKKCLMCHIRKNDLRKQYNVEFGIKVIRKSMKAEE